MLALVIQGPKLAIMMSQGNRLKAPINGVAKEITIAIMQHRIRERIGTHVALSSCSAFLLFFHLYVALLEFTP
ncbi:hypothetical protein Lalb_Chr18g0050721 [Lupinus albus]|uniref:Uncharacterized protein n=1 Tax=Lupinus albus TaxID=3870 RepID=A0A6A4NKF8_LUPAL|nr:hypothetical protein Lalb_Chr18g0050721 [Lupinus albus]